MPHPEPPRTPRADCPSVIHKASGIALVLIAPGEFTMGSPKDEPDRLRGEDQHRRVIRHPFYLGDTEVTVAQFRRFVTARRDFIGFRVVKRVEREPIL